MLVGYLQVVLRRNTLAVADPFADDMCGKRLRQFRLAAGSEIVPQPRPSFETRPPHDLHQLRSQIDARIAVASDDEHRPVLGPLESVFEVRLQLREQRHHPPRSAWPMLRFRTRHRYPALLPIHVAPAQRQAFRWSAQTAETGQGEQQPPFVIGTRRENLLGLVQHHEVEPISVCPDHADEVGERIVGNQLPPDRRPEDLFRDAAPLVDGVLRETLPEQKQPPIVGIAWRNVPQRFRCAEELQQVPLRVAPDDQRRSLHVGSLGDVLGEKRAELAALPRPDQAHGRELIARARKSSAVATEADAQKSIQAIEQDLTAAAEQHVRMEECCANGEVGAEMLVMCCDEAIQHLETAKAKNEQLLNRLAPKKHEGTSTPAARD